MLFFIDFIVSTGVVAPSVTARVSPPGPVVQGTTVDLVCEVTAGDGDISFSWTNPSGVGVSSSDTDSTISLSFSASGDYGTYTCTATSLFGMDTTSVEVIQAGSYSVKLSMKPFVCL